MPAYLIGLLALFVLHCDRVHSDPLSTLPSLARFSHISSSDGLSHSSVLSITQDSKGFLWFGTVMGLNRYDGYEFTRYYSQYDNPNSLPDNGILSMMVDRNGRLWVGTMKGLCRWRPNQSNFERIYDDPSDPLSFSDVQIEAMIEDETGLIWVGTTNGLYTIDVRDLYADADIPPSEYRTRIHPVATRDSEQQPFPQIPATSLVFDHNGILWIGTDQQGYYWLDREAGRHEAHRPAELIGARRPPRTVVSLAIDPENRLWVGTWDEGVYTLSADRQTLSHQSQLPIQVGRRLHVDSHDRLWIGTWGEGLYKVILQNNEVIHFQRDPARPSSLKSNLISSIFEDRSGNLWFGSISTGIHRLSRQANQFLHYQAILHDETSLSANQVTSLFVDSRETLWVGTYGGGLLQRNSDLTTFTHHPLTHSNTSIDVIWSIQESQEGYLWLATDRHSIQRFDPATRSLTELPAMIERIYEPRGNNSIRVMLLDAQNRLWGSRNNILYRFDLDTDISEMYDLGAIASSAASRIKSLYQDAEGHIWMGTDYDGVYRLNPETGEFINYRYQSNHPGSISGNSVNTILQDAKGNIWLGTYDGLNRYIPETNEFERVKPATEFPSNAIISIVEDHHGRLWISSHRGIMMYDPETGKVEDYYESDGLQENIFFLNSAASGQDGALYFGGPNGFNAFHPDRLIRNPHPPNLAITSIQVHGIPLETDAPYEEVTQLTLPYHQSFLSISFSALDFTNSAKNTYRYWLQGVHNQWIGPTFENRFHLSHLPPGEYLLRVQGSNNDGVFSDERQIRIRITPPFWKTTWFMVGTGLLVVAAILSWIRLRIVYITKRNKLLEERVAQRTSELQLTNLQLQEEMAKRLQIEEQLRQNQKMEAIGRLAGGIAHDFNNLLTVVNGYSDQLLRLMHNHPEFCKLLENIRHAGMRAANLTQQLLTFSRKQAIHLKSIDLHEALIDMKPLLLQLIDGKANLSIRVGASLPPIKVDPTQFQQLVMNLVINARDAYSNGGEINGDEILVNAEEVRLTGDETLRLTPGPGDYVRLSVADAGSGMNEEVLSRIFEPFFTTKEQGKGTGLGLSTVYGIVQQMESGIDVLSEEGKGTRFDIYFHLADGKRAQTSNIPAPDHAHQRISPEQETILLVEDEEAIRQLAKHILQKKGYTVLEAENGSAAFSLIEEQGNAIDVVVTDIAMPKMSGIILAQNVLALHPTMPVVFMAGYLDADELQSSFDEMAYQCISKPFQPEDLLQVVRHALDKRKPIPSP